MGARRSRRAASRRRSEQGGIGGLLILIVLAVAATREPWIILAGALVVALIVGAAIYVKLARRRRLRLAGIDEIDAMGGRQFEEKLEVLFRRRGYRVELTPYRGDYGADLVLTKNGRRTAVQAKRYRGNVGVKAIQEAVSAKGMYRCQDAMVVTNAYYTAAAKHLAAANGVELWDRDRLVRELAAAASEVNRRTGAPRELEETELQW